MDATPNLPDLDAAWDFDRPGESERAFRELLPLAEARSSEAYRLELLTQIARAQGLQRRFGDAHRTLDEIETGLSDRASRVRVRYLLERGRVLNSSGNRQQATPLFLNAWELGSAEGEDTLAVDAAHMLGVVASPEDRLTWNLRALDLAERSDDNGARRWLGSLYNNIGWAHYDQSRYDDALEMFRRAVAWQEAEGNPRQVITGRWCVARALRSLGCIEEALAMQRDLLNQLGQRGESDGYVHEELAECLLALGQGDVAQSHFAMAYDTLSADPWLVENESGRLRRLWELSQADFRHEPMWSIRQVHAAVGRRAMPAGRAARRCLRRPQRKG